MSFDIITSLMTRCSPYVRGLGYVAETIAMRNRSRKRVASWRPHLTRTRRFIADAAEGCPNKNRVVVLGSGLLLDVPLEGLASLFREVVLVDVVCLPEIRKSIGSYGNVTFIEHDVANVAEALYRNRQYGVHELPAVGTEDVEFCEQADLVVSLNILSQLGVVPRMYAAREFPGFADDMLDDWCRQIAAGHYAFLRGLACPVCLISDYEFVKRDRQGGVISRNSTLHGLEMPPPAVSWTWNIEPFQSTSQFYSKELIVGAWLFRQGLTKE